MGYVHTLVFAQSQKQPITGDSTAQKEATKLEPVAASTAVEIKGKLNASRLQNQMFAYTVTNQAINTFLEIGLPFVLRGVSSVRSGKGLHMSGRQKGPFPDDVNGEKAFIQDVKDQAALPEYSLFGVYGL